MMPAFKGSPDKLLRELDRAVIENLHNMQRQIQLRPFDWQKLYSTLYPESQSQHPA
jgi:hypothetical protein